MYKSSLYLYAGRDSSFAYLREALALNPNNVCGVLWRVRHIQHVNGNREWFIPDLQVPGIDSFMYATCGEKWVEAVNEPEIDRRPTVYTSKIADRIMRNDQKHRGDEAVNWEEQNKLDSLNRVYVDSLYLAKGTLHGFSREETDAISFVIHHAEDCHWVLKWLDIWLHEYHEGNFDGRGIVIGPAFDRMLMNDDAYCMGELPHLSKAFLERIRKEYPIEMGERYGYIKE